MAPKHRSRSYEREFRRTFPKVGRALDLQGWTIMIDSSNHIVFIDPEGRKAVRAAGTPSDRRSWKNTVSYLRRAGLEIER